MPTHFLNVSRDGDSTTSLGSLCQCLTILSENKLFLTSNLYHCEHREPEAELPACFLAACYSAWIAWRTIWPRFYLLLPTLYITQSMLNAHVSVAACSYTHLSQFPAEVLTNCSTSAELCLQNAAFSPHLQAGRGRALSAQLVPGACSWDPAGAGPWWLTSQSFRGPAAAICLLLCRVSGWG